MSPAEVGPPSRGLTCPGDRQVVLTERAAAVPGPGEVRLRVALSGVCGSDLHKYRAGATERAAGAGHFIGHEAVGTVEALGAGVDPAWRGRRVVAYHAWGCGGRCAGDCAVNDKRCLDLSIMGVHVDGGNAETQVVPAAKLLVVPETLTDEDAVAAVCNAGTAWSALRRLAVAPGARLAVWGLGPVGLAAVLLARSWGATVSAVDVVAERLEAAAGLGADRVVDARGLDADDLAAALGGAVDAAVETSGAAAVHAVLPGLVRHGGRVALVGMVPGAGLPDLRPVLLRELAVHGVFLYDQADWQAILADLARLDVPAGWLVSHRFAPEQAAEAFALADAGRCRKVAVRW